MKKRSRKGTLRVEDTLRWNEYIEMQSRKTALGLFFGVTKNLKKRPLRAAFVFSLFLECFVNLLTDEFLNFVEGLDVSNVDPFSIDVN